MKTVLLPGSAVKVAFSSPRRPNGLPFAETGHPDTKQGAPGLERGGESPVFTSPDSAFAGENPTLAAPGRAFVAPGRRFLSQRLLLPAKRRSHRLGRHSHPFFLSGSPQNNPTNLLPRHPSLPALLMKKDFVPDSFINLRDWATNPFDQIALLDPGLDWSAAEITAFQTPVGNIRDAAQTVLNKQGELDMATGSLRQTLQTVMPDVRRDINNLKTSPTYNIGIGQDLGVVTPSEHSGASIYQHEQTAARSPARKCVFLRIPFFHEPWNIGSR